MFAIISYTLLVIFSDSLLLRKDKKIKILNKCILDKKHNINKLVFIIDLYMTSEGNSWLEISENEVLQ